MTIGIYVIEHVVSGRRYVGQSVDVETRLRKHFEPASWNRGSRIGNAIRKYGCGAFTRALVEECNVEVLAEREVWWIAQLGTNGPAGFNLTSGGEGARGLVVGEVHRKKLSAAITGKTRFPETRAKMSAARCAYIAANKEAVDAILAEARAYIGPKKPLSVEARRRIGDAHRGKVVSNETRAKMSASHRGKRRPLSEETKRKIGEANRRKVGAEP